MKGTLCLEDGFLTYGELSNYQAETTGEVVFSTGMTGYDAALTDPSYAGQILVFSFPMVGNYGFVDSSSQSPWIAVQGLVTRDLWSGNVTAGTKTLPGRLSGSNRPVLHGVDTRSLVLHIRERGSMKAVISTVPDEGLKANDIERLKDTASSYDMKGVVEEVACKEPVVEGNLDGKKGTCVLVDFGVKNGMVESLMAEGFGVVRVPPTSTSEDILKWKPSLVFYSNGPGDPEDNPEAVESIKGLIGRIPVFGVCLGHQLIGLASGARKIKLHYGHHGANHPVHDLITGRAFITSQNHNYAIDPSSLPGNIAVTHKSLNDGTIEGLEVRGENGKVLAASVQFHPEGSPGPTYCRFWNRLEGAATHA